MGIFVQIATQSLTGWAVKNHKGPGEGQYDRPKVKYHHTGTQIQHWQAFASQSLFNDLQCISFLSSTHYLITYGVRLDETFLSLTHFAHVCGEGGTFNVVSSDNDRLIKHSTFDLIFFGTFRMFSEFSFFPYNSSKHFCFKIYLEI